MTEQQDKDREALYLEWMGGTEECDCGCEDDDMAEEQ